MPLAPLSALRRRAIALGLRSPSPLAQLRARRFGLDVVLRRPPTLELYYEPGDPLSHLAARVLERALPRLSIPARLRVVGRSDADAYPEEARQRAYAMLDAARVAPAYGLSFPERATSPTAAARLTAARALLGADSLAGALRLEGEVADEIFSGRPRTARPSVTMSGAISKLLSNQRRRARLGHYLPAMWMLDGAWYWGLDRLGFLEAHLRSLGALEGSAPLVTLDAAAARLPDAPPSATEGEAVQLFYSFRSPYSYLAVEELAKAPLGAPVTLRPVLPMVMRGIAAPLAKRLYIVRDVRREAGALSVPFGDIADPLGEGVLRCLRVFESLPEVQRMPFVCEASRGIWSRGVRVVEDAGMREVCERAGLDVSRALAVANERGRVPDFAAENRAALLEAGAWGVPTFVAPGFTAWGRDRLWLAREHVRRAQAPGTGGAGAIV